jgi:hypothetical protein
MGGRNRYRDAGIVNRPAWTLTVGDLADAAAAVHAYCPRCDHSTLVDVGPILAKYGRSFSLWNRRPRCRIRPDCDGRVWFWATRPNGGMWWVNMKDDDLV